MNRFVPISLLAATAFTPIVAWAQSTANQVQDGMLIPSGAGCPASLAPCWVPYSVANPLIVSVTSGGGAVTISAASTTSITTGGTSQTLFAASSITTAAWITNPAAASENLCVNVAGGAASTSASAAVFCLAAGQTLTLPKVSNAVTVVAATTGHVFSAISY